MKNRGEYIGLLESLVIGEGARRRAGLSDLAVDLAAKSAGLRRSLPPGIITALADLVRTMDWPYPVLTDTGLD